MPLGKDEINNRFGFHKATLEGPNATAPKHAVLREKFMEFANYLDNTLPEDGPSSSRLRDYTFYLLECTSMWAHKAIAGTAPLDSEHTLIVQQPGDPTVKQAIAEIEHIVQSPGPHYPDGSCCKDKINAVLEGR